MHKPHVPQDARYLLIGGGADPASNPISLAQDLESLAAALQGSKGVLFASGDRAPVAIEDEPRPKAAARDVLAQLFGRPGELELSYRTAELKTDGPAHKGAVRDALEALDGEGAPLLIYFAGHGEQGDRPAHNRILLWGGTSLTVEQLAKALPRNRPVRLVNTACFGGGFADVIFEAADPQAKLSEQRRCGLFAAPWNDEASGCDPNPDRRAQEGYSLHLLQALSGESEAADLDGDGQVGLLDAHTHARVRSRSFDVPTTSSERFLRVRTRETHVNPDHTRAAARALPEEQYVLTALGQPMGMTNETRAWQQIENLEREMDALDAQLSTAQAEADERFYDLRITLLERWPLLEHPWRAETQALVRRQNNTILRVAKESSAAKAYGQAVRTLDDLSARYDRLRIQRARVLRVARAFETLRLAQALHDSNRADWKAFQKLRRCERGVP